jgi:hypothetical protein
MLKEFKEFAMRGNEVGSLSRKKLAEYFFASF